MAPVFRHRVLWLECIALMVGLPILFARYLPLLYLLPVLWLLALACHSAYRAQTHATLRQWWNGAAVTQENLKPILRRFLVSAIGLSLVTALLAPELLLNFVRTAPAFWALVMVLYPLFSVIAQEIIFRSFFFARYQPLLRKPYALILASACAFGFSHILFANWVAPILCTIGGLYFAQTYTRHRSLALVAIEHALYGDFVFTLGLGRYFYHGAVGH